MERIAVAGLSLHQADVEGLEQAKRGLASLEAPAAKSLADGLGASEAVLLSTCNRLELVYARETGHAPGPEDVRDLTRALGLDPDAPLSRSFFLHTGRAAARHLLRVSASLDSLVVGEDQILAQLRAAYVEARALGLTGPLLGTLLDHAITLGKRVRSSTDLTRHPVSVVSLGVAFLREHVGPGAVVAVIGAGATGTHAARALLAAGLPPAWIVNRGEARARALAQEVGARVLSFEELRAGRVALDALVAATSAPAPVLDASALARLAASPPGGRTLVAVDLAVPRDLEPCAAPLRHIDLEALRERAAANRERRAAAAIEAELLVEERLALLFREREAGAWTGAYSSLAAQAREVFELELARLGEGRLAHLDPRDRSAVERWARRTFGHLAHVPFQMLKRLARDELLPQGEWEGLE